MLCGRLNRRQTAQFLFLRGCDKTEVASDVYQKKFRAAVGSVNWLCGNTRPDLSYEVMELSTKFGKATVSDDRAAGRLIKKAKEQSLVLKFQRLGEARELVVLVYGDGAVLAE